MNYQPVAPLSHILTRPHSSSTQNSSARGDVTWSSTIDEHRDRKVVLRVASSVVVNVENMTVRNMLGEEFAIHEKRSKDEKTLTELTVYKLWRVKLEVLELKKGDSHDSQSKETGWQRDDNSGHRADSITPWIPVQSLTASMPTCSTPKSLEHGVWPDNEPPIISEASKRKRSGTDELPYQGTQPLSSKEYTSSGRARMDPELERHRVVPEFGAGPKFTPINRMPVHTAQPFDDAARKNGSFGSFDSFWTPGMHIEHTVQERTMFQAQPQLEPVSDLARSVRPDRPKTCAMPVDVSRIAINSLVDPNQLLALTSLANAFPLPSTGSRIPIDRLIAHARLQATPHRTDTARPSDDEHTSFDQTASPSKRPSSATTRTDDETIPPRSDDPQDTDAEILRQFGDKSALAGTPFALGKSDLKDLPAGKLECLRKIAAQNAHRSSKKWGHQHGPEPVITDLGGAIDQNTLASSNGAHRNQQPTSFSERKSTLPPLPDNRTTLANATQGQRPKVGNLHALPHAAQKNSSASHYHSGNQLHLAPMRGLSTGASYVGDAGASGLRKSTTLPSFASLQLPEAKGPDEDLMVHDELWAWEGLPARFFKPRRRDWGFSGKGLNTWMQLDLMRGVETADGSQGGGRD